MKYVGTFLGVNLFAQTNDDAKARRLAIELLRLVGDMTKAEATLKVDSAKEVPSPDPSSPAVENALRAIGVRAGPQAKPCLECGKGKFLHTEENDGLCALCSAREDEMPGGFP